MADVKSESLKNITSLATNTNIESTEKMTVEKQLVNPPPASKNRTIIKDSNDEAPTVSPTQLKVASGNNAPVSPKKSDSKNSPTSKAPSGTQFKLSTQQTKNKGNPWYKNPSPTTSASGNPKKSSNLSPEGGDKTAGDSGGPAASKEDVSSQSIRIPQDEVSMCSFYVFNIIHCPPKTEFP